MSDKFAGFERQPGCSTMPPVPTNARSFPPKVPGGKQGKSQLEWVRRHQSGERLTTVRGQRGYTMSQVRKHNKRDDLWMVIDGKVYDFTSFRDYHPGGIGELMRGAGEEASALYHGIHPWVNLDFLAKNLVIGHLLPDEDEQAEAAATAAALRPGALYGGGASAGIGAPAPRQPLSRQARAQRHLRRALTLDSWKPFRLLLKKTIGKNALLLRFILLPGESPGLEVGQHLIVRVRKDGRATEREYTPVTPPWLGRSFDIWIRVYPEGALTPSLAALKAGVGLEMRGPKGPVRYKRGVLSLDDGESWAAVSRLCMVGGGSGVTPLLQIANSMAAKPLDNTPAHIVYFNHDRESILGEDAVRELAAKSNGQITVTMVLSEPPADGAWDGKVGRVSADLLRECFGEIQSEDAALWCGPPMFCKAVAGAVDMLGFSDKLCWQF